MSDQTQVVAPQATGTPAPQKQDSTHPFGPELKLVYRPGMSTYGIVAGRTVIGQVPVIIVQLARMDVVVYELATKRTATVWAGSRLEELVLEHLFRKVA